MGLGLETPVPENSINKDTATSARAINSKLHSKFKGLIQ